MPRLTSARIEEHFGDLPDPRRREVIYPLSNVVVIALCAVIGGADDFVAIARWAEVKQDWLAKFLDLSAGIPSHDRFNAIFKALKPAEFEKCLLSWIMALHEVTGGQVIAIDGKTLRRSFDAASSKAAIHMVSRPTYGRCPGHGQSHQPRPTGRRREEQRDHGHSKTAGNPGRFGLSGHDRRAGLPERDRPADRGPAG